MPNHSEAEKARIRDLTKAYLPPPLEQQHARRDCTYSSLHYIQASYGQKNFANIGLIFEFCRAEQHCQYHGKTLPMQMTAERRVDLLSELETLDPPPYHDAANIAICQSVRERILVSRNVTASSVFEPPATPHRERLSLIAIKSLAQSESQSNVASTPSTPSISRSRVQGTLDSTPPTTASHSSASKGPGRPRRNEVEVTVFAYLRDGHLVSTAKAVGYVSKRKQIEFKFFQAATAEAFGFNDASRPRFNMYLPHVDEWTDRIIPVMLVRGQPVLFRRDGVRNMPAFNDLKRLLNPPFDPNGVRPSSTFLDYMLGFPFGRARSDSTTGAQVSRRLSDPSRTMATIFGGPPSGSLLSHKDNEPGSSQKRPREEIVAGPSHKTRKRSLNNKSRHRSDRAEIIVLSDTEDLRPAKKGKGDAHATCSSGEEISASKKGKGKARAPPTEDDVIDLTI